MKHQEKRVDQTHKYNCRSTSKFSFYHFNYNFYVFFLEDLVEKEVIKKEIKK